VLPPSRTEGSDGQSYAKRVAETELLNRDTNGRLQRKTCGLHPSIEVDMLGHAADDDIVNDEADRVEIHHGQKVCRSTERCPPGRNPSRSARAARLLVECLKK
jgi:hypothetical protein